MAQMEHPPNCTPPVVTQKSNPGAAPFENDQWEVTQSQHSTDNTAGTGQYTESKEISIQKCGAKQLSVQQATITDKYCIFGLKALLSCIFNVLHTKKL